MWIFYMENKMNKQQEEAFLAEEKEASFKRLGCLLILGFVALEVCGVIAGAKYYLAHQDRKTAPEPEKIIKHTDSKNKIVFEHTR